MSKPLKCSQQSLVMAPFWSGNLPRCSDGKWKRGKCQIHLKNPRGAENHKLIKLYGDVHHIDNFCPLDFVQNLLGHQREKWKISMWDFWNGQICQLFVGLFFSPTGSKSSHNIPLVQTDRQTDGQTDGVTALLDLLSPSATQVKILEWDVKHQNKQNKWYDWPLGPYTFLRTMSVWRLKPYGKPWGKILIKS